MKLSTLISVPAIMLSSLAFSQTIEANKTHSVGFQLGGGGAEYKNSTADGEGVGQGYIYYNYRFMPNYYLELGLSGGSELDKWTCNEKEDGSWLCKAKDKAIFNIQADELNYQAVVAAIKGQYPLTKRNSLYGKLGAQFYDYEFKRGSLMVADDSGVSLLMEAGWQYCWDSGMGVNTGIQYQTMGDLKLSSLNVGISYSF